MHHSRKLGSSMGYLEIWNWSLVKHIKMLLSKYLSIEIPNHQIDKTAIVK